MGFIQKRLRPRLLGVYALALLLVWIAEPTPRSLAAGGSLALAGELLRLWATGHLHKNADLTVTGPYAYLRHPLYLGTLSIGTGLALMASTAWAFAVWFICLFGYFGYYMPYKNRIEGARLEELFGDRYRRFSLAVPRLVPRLHAYRPLEPSRATEEGWNWKRFVSNHELGTAAVVGVGAAAMVCRWAFI